MLQVSELFTTRANWCDDRGGIAGGVVDTGGNTHHAIHTMRARVSACTHLHVR